MGHSGAPAPTQTMLWRPHSTCGFSTASTTAPGMMPDDSPGAALWKTHQHGTSFPQSSPQSMTRLLPGGNRPVATVHPADDNPVAETPGRPLWLPVRKQQRQQPSPLSKDVRQAAEPSYASSGPKMSQGSGPTCRNTRKGPFRYPGTTMPTM